MHSHSSAAAGECTAHGAISTVLHAVGAINDAYDTDASWDVIIAVRPGICSLRLEPPCRMPVFEHSPLQTWVVERMDLDMNGMPNLFCICTY